MTYYACEHLIENDTDPYRWFTGTGTTYHLICNQCRDDLPTALKCLKLVSAEQFFEFDAYHDGRIGDPEILSRETNLLFTHRTIRIDGIEAIICCIVPQLHTTSSCWMALLDTGEIVHLDLDNQENRVLMRVVDSDDFSLTSAVQLRLHLSPNGRYAAIVDDKGSQGIIVDLETTEITMRLNRGKYHPEQTPFPLAFFTQDDKTLVVHGINWNRLTISDVATGKNLIERPWPKDFEGTTGYDLNYFRGLPLISPDATWIAEDGWIWSPCGRTIAWNLQHWLKDNIWLSDDRSAIHWLNQRFYYWNSPMCWIFNHELAVWGWGSDDQNLCSAVQIFDVRNLSRRPYRIIAGVKEGHLYCDRYLFSVSKTDIEVWDIDTGERLLSDSTFSPICYHCGTHEFLTILSSREFQLTQLGGI